MRRIRLFLAMLFIVASVGAIAPSSAQAAGLPGGKSQFVLSFMGYRTQGAKDPSSAFNRVSEITFNTNGTLTERYWSWNAQMAPVVNSAKANRVQVGTTTGCSKACGVFAPVSFDKAGSTRTGTWRQDSISGKAYAVIYWDATGTRETYEIKTIDPTLTELSLTSHTHSNVVRAVGRAYGSNYKGAGVTPQSIGKVALNPPASMGDTNLHTKRWGAGTYMQQKQPIDMGNFKPCSTASNCLVAGDRVGSTWLQYMHFQPGTRKVTWYNMIVHKDNTPTPTECIRNDRGGHQWAMLQVIDDSGKFRGLVGAEASLYGRADASNYVAMIAAIR